MGIDVIIKIPQGSRTSTRWMPGAGGFGWTGRSTSTRFPGSARLRATGSPSGRERGIEAVILGPGENLAALTQAAVTNGADALGGGWR